MFDGGKKLSYHRKLWGLHLDPYMSSISYIVQNFLACSSNDLQQMLRRVCAQLADINADLATLVTQQVHICKPSVITLGTGRISSGSGSLHILWFLLYLPFDQTHCSTHLKDYSSYHFFMKKHFTRYVCLEK